MSTISARPVGTQSRQDSRQANMSIRARLASNRRLGLGVAIALLILSSGLIAHQVMEARNSVSGPLRVYYTVDDGKTFFADDEGKLPPFPHSGGTAVRAHVFEGSKGPFVGYLERFSPDALQIINVVSDAAKTAKPGDKPPPELARVSNAQRNGRQVKKPGTGQWVPIHSGVGQAIMKVTRPGSNEPASELRPE
jgi:hypothetical protein